MKKIILFSAIIALVSLSCRKALKDVKDYFPTVKTVSATVNLDGDVVVTGNVESHGEKQLEYVGFCFDTIPVPDMMTNQAIESLSGTSFTHTYSNFDPLKTYYFRTWAVNGNGYTYGNVASLSGIAGTPVTPPCTLTMNYLDLGSGNGNSTYANIGSPVQNSTWDFSASSNSSGTLHFKFGSKPRTKVFTTTFSSSPNSNEVHVNFYHSIIAESIEPGNKVYVNEISPGLYDISICAASWKYNGGSTFYLNTRFTCPY